MPIVIACTACQNPMRVGDQLAGKAVKCPKCGQAVRVPAAVAVAAAPRQAPAPEPAAAPTIAVACGACQKRLSVRAALAGKAVKCPGCGQPVRIPAPAAPDGDEWLEVNEAAAPAPVPASLAAPAAAPKRDGAPAGDWGQALLTEKGIPDEMQDELRTELGKSERVVWADRPRQDILLHQAKMHAMIGGPITGLICLIAVIVMVVCAIKGVIWAIFVALVFAGLSGVFCWILVTGPGRVVRGEAKRPCFVMTNRRLLIHQGKGMQMRFHTSREGGTDGPDGPMTGVVPWTGFELTRLARIESKKFEGAGSLSFARTLFEETDTEYLWALDNVRGVEKMLREKLLHPIIDKMLRGESLSKDEKGKVPGAESAGAGEDVVAADTNIKSYGGARGRVNANDPNVKAAPSAARGADGNVKGAPSALRFDLARVPAELREQVEAEMTAGEQILWIGEPEGKTKGRGFFGTIAGAAPRVEPKYELYAITNRRVIMFVEKKGPLSYYTPTVASAGLEDDTRFERGGNIVFKKIKKTVTTTYKDGKTKTEVTMHYFGLLRIANYRAVADLLYDTLVAPCRGV